MVDSVRKGITLQARGIASVVQEKYSVRLGVEITPITTPTDICLNSLDITLNLIPNPLKVEAIRFVGDLMDGKCYTYAKPDDWARFKLVIKNKNWVEWSTEYQTLWIHATRQPGMMISTLMTEDGDELPIS